MLFIALRTFNQILFKYVALGPGGASYSALIFDPLFYIAFLIFIAQAVVWLFVLNRFSLSCVYPFTSLTFVTIMASGAIFFKEIITLGNVFGAVVIIAGAAVVAKGNNEMRNKGSSHP